MLGKYPERIALFIDAANLYYVTRALNMNIDFIKFLSFFKNRHTYLAYAGYYTAVEELSNGDRPLQRLLDFLSDHGYTLVTKPTKAYDQPDRTRKIKGNTDVEMACDVLEMCLHVDRVVLVTGDGDFRTLVERVQKKGRQVTIVSSRRANMLSTDLRKAATDTIDLADIADEICSPERVPQL